MFYISPRHDSLCALNKIIIKYKKKLISRRAPWLSTSCFAWEYPRPIRMCSVQFSKFYSTKKRWSSERILSDVTFSWFWLWQNSSSWCSTMAYSSQHIWCVRCSIIQLFCKWTQQFSCSIERMPNKTLSSVSFLPCQNFAEYENSLRNSRHFQHLSTAAIESQVDAHYKHSSSRRSLSYRALLRKFGELQKLRSRVSVDIVIDDINFHSHTSRDQ